jgi:D-threo-aldose 1-dehydrogenase
MPTEERPSGSTGEPNRQRFVPPGPIGLGGAPLGNLFARLPPGVATATITTAWDLGIRHFDTAPMYGTGLSEHRMGEVLRDRPRDSFVLSTKVGRLLDPAPDAPELQNGFVGGLPFRVRYDYGYDAARRSIEDSLQRLGLARIDIAYIHDVGEDTHGSAWRSMFDDAMRGAARALSELRADGTIRAWGLGVNRVEPCRLALGEADPDLFLLAGRYTLLDTSALDELFPLCERRGVRVVVGGPYNSGLLAGGTTFDYEAAPSEKVARVQQIARLCAQHGVDIRAAALQFCAAAPVVVAVIPGARNPEEVRQNAAMMAARIPGELWDALRRDRLIPDHAPVPGSPAATGS